MLELFRETLKRLLKVDDTPRRIALAYAIGVFLAFSPLLGLHAVLGLGIAFRFGLSRLAMLAGVFTNSPWTLVPYYTLATWVGSLMVPGRSFVPPGLLEAGFRDLLTIQFWKLLASSWPLLIPFFIGSTLLALMLALAAFPLAFTVLRKLRHTEGSKPEQA